MDNPSLTLSELSKTWLFDLDGTIVKHNGYLVDGFDSAIDCSVDFIKNLPESDKIIILTSRSKRYSTLTEEFLVDHGIRFDAIIYDLPVGERVLVNDKKPSGLLTSYSVNTERDVGIKTSVTIDKSL